MGKPSKRVNTPPSYAEAMKINKDGMKLNKEQPRRLLNRATVKNTLAERAIQRGLVQQGKHAKESAATINVNSNTFLPKLRDPNTGNSRMRGINPYAPEPQLIKDGTSYLDKYQMKPGFHLPDVQDKIGIAHRHQLQVRAVPKEMVRLEDEHDDSYPVRHRREFDLNSMSPSELIMEVTHLHGRNSPCNYMPSATPLHLTGPPNMPLGEGAYAPVPPGSPHYESAATFMPHPPSIPRGEGHTFTVNDHVIFINHSQSELRSEPAHVVPQAAPQPWIDGAKFMPVPPPMPKKCGSERSLPSRDGAQNPHQQQHRGCAKKKKLPPLQKGGAKQKRAH